MGGAAEHRDAGAYADSGGGMSLSYRDPLLDAIALTPFIYTIHTILYETD